MQFKDSDYQKLYQNELITSYRQYYYQIVNILFFIQNLSTMISELINGEDQTFTNMQIVYCGIILIYIALWGRYNIPFMGSAFIIGILIINKYSSYYDIEFYSPLSFADGIWLCIYIQQITWKQKMFIYVCMIPFLSFSHSSFEYYIKYISMWIGLMIIGYMAESKRLILFQGQQMNKVWQSMVQELTSDSILMINYNNRQNQCLLEFYNSYAESQYGVSDPDTLKELLRTTTITIKQEQSGFDLQQNLKQSVDQSVRRLITQKHVNLESFVVKRLQNDDNYEEELTNATDLQQGKVSVITKLIQTGSKTLIIIFKQNHTENTSEKTHQQKQYLQKVMTCIMDQVTYSQVKVFKCLKNITKSNIMTIQCMNLLILNQYYNIQCFLNHTKEQYGVGKITQFNLHKYCIQLFDYLKHMGIKLRKRISVQCQFDASLTLLHNERILTQVIINVLEMALQYAESDSTIDVRVSMCKSLDPERDVDSQADGLGNYCQSIPDLDLRQKQELIKFNFTFNSTENESEQELILNPQTAEQYEHNNLIEFNIAKPVTKLLINRLGPYNQLFHLITPQYQYGSQFLHQIYFYVYTDQTMIDKSFLSRVQQKSFLQF